MYTCASSRLPGRCMVVNFVVFVTDLPLSDLAVTVAVYVVV
jgi:hypothetical protein